LLDVMRCQNQIQENRHSWGGRLGLSGVAHQNGTVRFGSDPATSALDLNCKLHELDNLAERLGSPLPAGERLSLPAEHPPAATTPA
jgi:GMC oxidoreductase